MRRTAAARDGACRPARAGRARRADDASAERDTPPARRPHAAPPTCRHAPTAASARRRRGLPPRPIRTRGPSPPAVRLPSSLHAHRPTAWPPQGGRHARRTRRGGGAAADPPAALRVASRRGRARARGGAPQPVPRRPRWWALAAHGRSRRHRQCRRQWPRCVAGRSDGTNAPPLHVARPLVPRGASSTRRFRLPAGACKASGMGTARGNQRARCLLGSHPHAQNQLEDKAHPTHPPMRTRYPCHALTTLPIHLPATPPSNSPHKPPRQTRTRPYQPLSTTPHTQQRKEKPRSSNHPSPSPHARNTTATHHHATLPRQ